MIALVIVLSILGLLVSFAVIQYETHKKEVRKMTPAEEARFELSENQYVRDLITHGVGHLDHEPGRANL